MPDDPSKSMMHDFGLVYSTLEDDGRFELEDGAFGLCTASSKTRLLPVADHVLISGLIAVR